MPALPNTEFRTRLLYVDIHSLIRPEILELSPYRVQEQKGYVKLDAMECPYPWPESLKTDWLDRLAKIEINRYPDAELTTLKSAVKEFFEAPESAELLFGNGSDELIQMLLMAVAGQGRGILSVEPTFTMYRIIARTLGLDYHAVDLREDFSLDADAMLEAVQRHQPAIVFLAYPNNPTGNNFEASAIETIIQQAPGLVVVDEAYYAFSPVTLLDQVGRFDNLLVMRTLSKIGMAGLRFGMLFGPGPIMQQLGKIRLPYNINALTQASIRFVMEHFAPFEKQVEQICQQRQWLTKQLQQAAKVETVYPSMANFLTFRSRAGEAGAIFEGLKAQKILIKILHGSSPRLTDCLRVTVGTEQENQAFMEALNAIAVQ
ncbi:MAG: histidinol-phosphate transaminase [Gammaproteobacteria bacterium]|nr:MAG: histidinol-phosphate transaminase [Gammaproteobacteria bacterium]